MRATVTGLIKVQCRLIKALERAQLEGREFVAIVANETDLPLTGTPVLQNLRDALSLRAIPSARSHGARWAFCSQAMEEVADLAVRVGRAAAFADGAEGRSFWRKVGEAASREDMKLLQGGLFRHARFSGFPSGPTSLVFRR